MLVSDRNLSEEEKEKKLQYGLEREYGKKFPECKK